MWVPNGDSLGATLGPSYYGGSTVSLYKPSTDFIPLYGQSLIFSVEGVQDAVQTVPEPSTLLERRTLG